MRLSSAGLPLPGVEVSIRDDVGNELPAGAVGEIFVRGEQVSGEYLEKGSLLDEHGWFPTKDGGYIDEGGYLFVQGRNDDIIIRGGENIAPAEVEDVILRHPDVADAVAFGVPDEEWGARLVLAAVLVPGAEATESELSAWIREQSRASRTPDQIVFRDKLPYTDTGKILRREVQASVT